MNRRQWQSTQERVDELTGKISVKQRDNESIFKKQHEAIEKNEGKFLTSDSKFLKFCFRKNCKSACDCEGSASKIGKNDEQRQPGD